MNSEIFIPILTAIIGGILAGIPSLVSYRIKKVELEHAYRISSTERFQKITHKYVEDIYKPLYRVLINLEAYIKDSQIDVNSFTKGIYLQISSLKELLSKEERMFLSKDIENELVEMYWFIANSFNTRSVNIGIKNTFQIFGVRSVKYLEGTYKCEIKARLKINTLKFIERIIKFFNFLTLNLGVSNNINGSFEIYYKAAAVGSDIFKKQLEKYINSLKNQVKLVLIGEVH